MARDASDGNRALRKLHNTPEIFVQVMSLLGPEDLLLRIPRVCKAWKAIVESSRLTRTALYFEPDFQCTSHDNPMLGKVFPLFYQCYSGRGHELVEMLPWIYYDDDLQELDAFTTECSDLVSRSKEIAKRHKQAVESSWTQSLAVWRKTTNCEMRDAILTKEASWRRMVTHQPPVMHLEIVSDLSKRSPDCIEHECRQPGSIQYKPNGLRMGEMWDMLLREYVQGPGSLRTKVAHENFKTVHSRECANYYRNYHTRISELRTFGRPCEVETKVGTYLLVFFKRIGRMQAGELQKKQNQQRLFELGIMEAQEL